MKYRDINISIFANCKSKYSTKTINLWQWLLLEGRGAEYETIELIRKLTCPAQIGELKKQLRCVTMSGIFEERYASKIITHSGLICIDIDAKDNLNTTMETMKESIKTLNYILYSGLSVSGKGFFCLVPLSNPSKHLEHYYALEKDFLDLGIIIDSNCTDLSRLRFLSYDPSPYVNPNAVVYSKLLKESIKSNSHNYKHEVPLINIAKQAYNKPNKINREIYEDELLSLISSNIDGNEIIPIYPIYMYSDDEKRASILHLVETIVNSKIDITLLRKDWITIAGVIVRYFKESGREIFHSISQFYQTDRFCYSYLECETVYNQMLQAKYQYSYERIFEVSRKYGLK